MFAGLPAAVSILWSGYPGRAGLASCPQALPRDECSRIEVFGVLTVHVLRVVVDLEYPFAFGLLMLR